MRGFKSNDSLSVPTFDSKGSVSVLVEVIKSNRSRLVRDVSFPSCCEIGVRTSSNRN